MSDDLKVDLQSWARMAEAITREASAALSDLSSVVASTTSPGSCGAHGPEIDAAVAVMLSSFGGAMSGDVIPEIQKAFQAEAEGLAATGRMFQHMEEDALELASNVLRGEL